MTREYSSEFLLSFMQYWRRQCMIADDVYEQKIKLLEKRTKKIKNTPLVDIIYDVFECERDDIAFYRQDIIKELTINFNEKAKKTVANFVVSKRLYNGWTQKDLATALGISASTISELEAQKRKTLSVEFLKSICIVFKTNLEDVAVISDVQKRIDTERFASLVRNKRKQRFMTQCELADRSNLAVSVISSIERNLYKEIHFQRAKRICDVLGVSVLSFVAGRSVTLEDSFTKEQLSIFMKDYRSRKKINQRSLALKLGVSEGEIKALEACIIETPASSIISKICGGLKCKRSDIAATMVFEHVRIPSTSMATYFEKYLEENKLTLTGFSRESKVNKATLRKIVDCVPTHFTMYTIHCLCRAMDCTPQDIVDFGNRPVKLPLIRRQKPPVLV